MTELPPQSCTSSYQHLGNEFWDDTEVQTTAVWSTFLQRQILTQDVHPPWDSVPQDRKEPLLALRGPLANAK